MLLQQIPLASWKTPRLQSIYKRKCKCRFDIPKLLSVLNTQTFCFQNLLLTEDSSSLLGFFESQNVSHLSYSIYKELEFRGETLWEATMLCYAAICLMCSLQSSGMSASTAKQQVIPLYAFFFYLKI